MIPQLLTPWQRSVSSPAGVKPSAGMMKPTCVGWMEWAARRPSEHDLAHSWAGGLMRDRVGWME
jgi:hypothetical protein